MPVYILQDLYEYAIYYPRSLDKIQQKLNKRQNLTIRCTVYVMVYPTTQVM